MTTRQITILIKQTVANALIDFFADPDLGKPVKRSFLKSLKDARNESKGFLTLAQFRKQYSF